jgi:zinc D-Ala-D-Ala dipeptidase
MNSFHNPILEIQGLVNVQAIDDSIVLDMRYATTNNFTGKVIYPANLCILQRETATKLCNANSKLKSMGYKLKIWDAYRPIYVQKLFWEMIHDSRFVADPSDHPSRHNFGTAVDVTLVDFNNNELIMPSEFDDFSEKAYGTDKNMSSTAKKNLTILISIMKESGFLTIDTEWWHFEDNGFKKFQLVDIDLKCFI